MIDPTTFMNWRTSSYSSGNPNNCVEVGVAPGRVGVRDSKMGEVGPVLGFGLTSWAIFVGDAARGAGSRS
jgi:hypothetical protein